MPRSDRVSATNWHVIRLASRALWLPTHELENLVTCGGYRAVTAAESAWEPDALVPTHEWQEIRTTQPVAATRAFDRSRDVALVPVLEDVELLSPEQLLNGLGDVELYVEDSIKPPEQSTLTFDPASDRLIGLHLDNWDRRRTSSRYLSRNRASINLGPGWRALLFVDVDVLGSNPTDAVPDTRSARTALRDAPTPPAVLRLLVPPGWAYLAPTESLVHDASTTGCGTRARSVAALGTFAPTPDLAEVAVVAAT